MANVAEADRTEEVFDFVGKTEEAALHAGRKFAKAVGDFLPVEVPLVRELVKGVFDFTEEILKTQRELARNLTMLEETRDKVGRAAPRAPEQHRAEGSHRVQSKTA